MLALARQLGVDPNGYVTATHPVQQAVAATIARYCDVDLADAPMGIDGCSVPTWAYPLRNMALGFARLTDPGNAAAQWIIRAARNHPFMIAAATAMTPPSCRSCRGCSSRLAPKASIAAAFPTPVWASPSRSMMAQHVRLKPRSHRCCCHLTSGRPRNAPSSAQSCTRIVLKNWRGLDVGAVEAAV
jgi:hypothetical protein